MTEAGPTYVVRRKHQFICSKPNERIQVIVTFYVFCGFVKFKKK